MPNYTLTSQWTKLSTIMGAAYKSTDNHRLHVNPTSNWVYYSDDATLPADEGSAIKEFQEVILYADNYVRANNGTVVNISSAGAK